MDCSSSCVLVLRGKSRAENKIAEALKNTNALKLSDGSELSILLDSESEKPSKADEGFGIESFMKSLSTDRFGRFLLWSPRLPSTQDVVSQNFCELPNGAVCVADVQYKGRGLKCKSSIELRFKDRHYLHLEESNLKSLFTVFEDLVE